MTPAERHVFDARLVVVEPYLLSARLPHVWGWRLGEWLLSLRTVPR